MLRITVLLFTFGLLPVLDATAADPWIGKKVFWKADATMKIGSREVSWEGKISAPATVEAVNGDWLWLGRGWFQKSDVLNIDQAVEYFSKRISEDPKNPRRWINRASIWIEKKDFDKALEDLSEAIRLAPGIPMTYNTRGGVWQRKGNIDNSIEDFSKAIELIPGKFATAHMNRGIMWEKKKEYEKAIDDYSEAIRIDPKKYTAYVKRGGAWSKKGEFDIAIADFNEAFRLDPTSPVAFNGAAWFRATCPDARYRDGKKAIALATEACKLTAWNDATYLDTLAAAYAEAGDFDSAIKHQNKAIELDPTEAELKPHLELYKDHKPYRDE